MSVVCVLLGAHGSQNVYHPGSSKFSIKTYQVSHYLDFITAKRFTQKSMLSLYEA